MHPRLSPRLFQRSLFTTPRVRATISPLPSTHLPTTAPSVPKLGRIARWYLPTMALLAVGTIYIPESLTSRPRTPRTVTLDSANRTIGLAITHALNETNLAPSRPREPTQDQRNQMLMEAYGARSTLEDVEKAFEQMERAVSGGAEDAAERNRRLEDAYGDRASLRDIERAMQVYEVQ